MHLRLDFPEPWSVHAAPGARYVATLDEAGSRRAVVTFGPMRVQPDDRQVWIESALLADLDDRCRVKVHAQAELETRSGWPVRTIEADAHGPDGDLVEARLLVCYDFMEHIAVAVFKTGTAADRESLRDDFVQIALSGRPEWGTPPTLFDLWDMGGKREHAGVDRGRSAAGVGDGVELLALGRLAEALASFERAAETDPDSEPAHFYRGVALGRLGRHDEAAGAWQRALDLAPDRLETLYNLAQSLFLSGDFESALRHFNRAFDLSGDLFTLRKSIQCLYGLGRFDEGEASRVKLRELWRASADPRTTLVREYVFHQIPAGANQVHAVEPLDGGGAILFQRVDPKDQPVDGRIRVEADGDELVLRSDSDELERLPAGARYSELVARALVHLGGKEIEGPPVT